MTSKNIRNLLLTLSTAALVISTSACKKESVYEKIARDAKTFTEKNCPKKMDDYTIMDSTSYDFKTKSFIYYYTVSDKLDDTSLYTGELKNTFRNTVLTEIKHSIPMKGYKEAGLTFVYNYRSKSTQKVLLQLRFTPEDYN